jgi:hypothetical protein
MATIMATHMALNITTEAAHDPIGIQTIDMVQPPGMSMAPRIVAQKYAVGMAPKAKPANAAA